MLTKDQVEFLTILKRERSMNIVRFSPQQNYSTYMNAVVYCRVYSKEQIEGTSLESQEVARHDYARSKGMHVLKVFVEQGESAKFADRTQLLELVDFCRQNKGRVDTVLVW